MSNQFAAGPQALGYLYQFRFALLRALQAADDVRVHLEQLDDLVLEENGTPAQLLSFKHQCTPAPLSNASPDLWKTLRIWATRLADGAILPGETLLTLMTTATAADDSAAALLRPGDKRDPMRALALLENTSQTSKNEDLKKAFSAFNTLDRTQRELLVGMIEVLDRSPDIVDLQSLLADELSLATRREHRNHLVERLEGWWFDKCVRVLRGVAGPAIPVYEVQDQVRIIAEQFHPDALPIDFAEALPANPPDPAVDNRRFVSQLRLIGVGSARVEKAIVDYYRAFEQRSRWAREDLLIGDEVEKYERTLVDEWERYRLAVLDELDPGATEELLRQAGREIYNWMEQTSNIRIRPGVTADYVRRGSYHLLADKAPPIVGWHPRFADRLAALLGASS